MAEDINDELREAICNSIPYVNNQVVQAAIDGDFSNSPQWIWRNHENGCVGFGRWPHHPDAAPYIRADLIVAVLARMATSHALGFKVGIEAGAGIAQQRMADEERKALDDPPEDDELLARRIAAHSTAVVIRDQIHRVPTPPSMLPEIMEAMRPAKKHAVELEQCSLFVDSEPLKRAMTDAAADLRNLDAAFTKLGGKL